MKTILHTSVSAVVCPDFSLYLNLLKPVTAGSEDTKYQSHIMMMMNCMTYDFAKVVKLLTVGF